MASFLVVISVIMLGSAFFFVINSPSATLFSYHGVFGSFWPLMSVFELMLGQFSVVDYETWPGVFGLIVFVFISALSLTNQQIGCFHSCLESNVPLTAEKRFLSP